jgi:hypothetical protein
VNLLLKRVAEFVDRHGETFTVSGSHRRGFFSNASYGQLRNYLPESELNLLTPPYWVSLVAGSDPTTVGDTLVWSGRSFQVRSLLMARWRATVVAKLLVLGDPSPVEI